MSNVTKREAHISHVDIELCQQQSERLHLKRRACERQKWDAQNQTNK